jgi:hypothetical protein
VLNSIAFAVISSFCPNLRSLNLQNCTGITSHRLSELIEQAPALFKNLTELRLGSTFHEGMSAVVQACPQLKVVSFEKAEAKGIVTFFQKAQNLVSIELSETNVSKEILQSLAERNPNVEELLLHQTNLPFKEYSKVISKLKLKSFGGFNVEDMEKLLKKFPDLVSLHLRGIANSFPSPKKQFTLKSLNIVDSKLDENCFANIVRIPTLESLYIFNCGKFGVAPFQVDFRETFPNMKNVFIGFDNALSAFTFSKLLSIWPSLTSLDFSEFTFTKADSPVATNGAAHFSTKIETIILNGKHELDRLFMFQFGVRCPNISVLHLTGFDLNDGPIISLSARCRKLTDLDISDVKFTAAGLQEVARNIPHLKSLGTPSLKLEVLEIFRDPKLFPELQVLKFKALGAIKSSALALFDQRPGMLFISATNIITKDGTRNYYNFMGKDCLGGYNQTFFSTKPPSPIVTWLYHRLLIWRKAVLVAPERKNE